MRKTRWAVVGVALVAFCILAAAAYGQNSITTVAGGGPNNVAATTASIGYPWGVARFGTNTYLSDSLSHRIFKVDSNGTLTIVAGDTVAGNTGDYDPNDPDPQPATLASLNGPEGIAVDSTGNVYIADTNSFAIRVLNTTNSTINIAGVQIGSGAISTVVGCVNPPCSTGENVSAQSAQLNSPAGVGLDAAGNIYLADTLNHAIRVVNTQSADIHIAGVTISPNSIATVAGTLGNFGATGDGGLATSATLTSPNGVFVDANGNIFIADTNNSAIRVVNTQAGDITIDGVLIHASDIDTVAGTITSACSPAGSPPFCGDTGLATSAQLNFPRGVFVDGAENIYIADTGDNVVRKVDAGTSDIDAIAGEYFSCNSVPCGDGGASTSAQLAFPTAAFLDGTNIYIADQNDNAIRKVDTNSGNISTIAGPLATMFDLAFYGDGGPATNAELYYPVAAAVDPVGNILIADSFNNVIRKVDTASGDISTVVGTGETFCTAAPACGENVLPANALLSYPSDVFVDGAGNIFIADYQPGTGPLPLAVIREIPAATGKIVTVVGSLTGGLGFGGDGGPATAAQLSGPVFGSTPPLGVFVDNSGIIYIADSLNQRIRVVNTTASPVTIAGRNIAAGNIDTVAGDGTVCADPTTPCGDGGAARSAQLNNPTGVAVDKDGNIYIADNADNRIRKVATAGTITTFAGTGNECASQGCGDGSPATGADLDAPTDVVVDFAGNVFIADTADFAVREVTIADGNINTVANPAQKHGFGGDGPNALLASPFGLTIDASGAVYTVDFGQWRVRKVAAVAATAPTATPSPTSLLFAAQTVNTTSAVKTVTLTNNGNLTTLTNLSAAITGADKTDFAIASSSTCGSSLAAGDSCTYDVTFTPSSARGFNAALTITDNATDSPQSVPLSGTGVGAADFTITATAASPATVSAGGSATSTVTVTAQNGFNSAITLTCSVSPSSTNAPGCGLNPTSLPTGHGTSTLTITTTAASASLTRPAIGHRSAPFYAFWLFLPALLFSTAGMTAPKRKKLTSSILLFLAVAGLLFLAACGGGSNNNGGGGGGGGGTAAGTYTVTVTATPAAGTAHTTTVTLTVQ